WSSDVCSSDLQDYVRKDEVQSPIVVVDSVSISEKMKIVYTSLPDDVKLTQRQSQILELILDGKTRKEIASKLIISENTVKMHTSMLYDTLGVKNKEEIFALVYKNKEN
ncbi:MAG: helix-turn-helix transcriptional regulator, partial [Clostridia bacterium]|nr:helix-turn-helix transcriptional regulator [Clostridia bacterium]